MPLRVLCQVFVCLFVCWFVGLTFRGEKKKKKKKLKNSNSQFITHNPQPTKVYYSFDAESAGHVPSHSATKDSTQDRGEEGDKTERKGEKEEQK
ncbi:hypothetical protein IWX47DRAFT_181943 [Phyllosticta citricarpa]